MGTAPTLQQSILGIMLRAIDIDIYVYLYIMTADLIQLLQGGGAVPKVYIFAKGSFS